MIKFYGPSGESHFGQATITRTTSVNGGLSLTGEVFAGDDVLNGLDYGWWLNFDNEKYVITYKKLSDDTNTIVFDAVQQFFWDFSKVALHSQYTGSHEYAFYLRQLFNESGYTYKNDVTVPAFEKENWGYKNKLDLFNDIMDQVDVEFEVHNEMVHIAKQIGSDLTSFVRKGINLSDLTEEMKISDFATYAKGYGAFKDQQDPSKGRLEVEYRSELADRFGDLEMDPIIDERYTIASNLIAELKKKIDATYTVSMTMNIYDLESAGYPNYESPKVGDWILAIDEALNFKRKIRIIKLEEQFDVIGKRIGYTATCGDLSIVDQYTNIQGSLDSKVQRIQESLDYVASSANGKSSNYYGTKEPVNANDGDLWFDQSNSDPDKWSIKQWANGRWEQLTLNPGEVDAKVNVAKQEAEKAVDNAKSAADKADQLSAKYDDTNSLANQALGKATSAQSDASSAVAKAESTASGFGEVSKKADSALSTALNAQTDASSAVAKAESTALEFGKVSQKTDTAAANALSAQASASDAVKQASSAAADSKDAKQIAGAVSQSYKTLTDGSTMTLAELESGLAAKLTRTDLDGYATQTWAQNQINVSADAINTTLSSVKSTVDSQTTSINDLKADSSSFKSQFTTVNNTLGKQTTDISSLQASSKELATGFNTLTTDNNTNKNDISQLKQTATEVSSTLETVQTQVQNSSVGTNLYQDTRDFDNPNIWSYYSDWHKAAEKFNGLTVMVANADWFGLGQDVQAKKGEIYTFSVYARYESGTGKSNMYFATSIANTYPGTVQVSLNETWQRVIGTVTITADGPLHARIERSHDNTNTLLIAGLKLERGSKATDYSVSPLDNATVTAVSKISQTVDGIKTDVSKKIEQKDLNGYATQIWTQNQIKMTADGINGTISSIKGTVDSQTTSINDLKADSSGFKAQFTTVNNTIGKQTTDISTLQATSKELTTGFNTLTTDNITNKNDISQLKQTSTELNSTMMTVQTQVQNSAVGTNLLTGTGSHTVTGSNSSGYLSNETLEDLLALFKGLEGQTVTVSVDYEYSGFILGSSQNRLRWETKILADTASYFGPWHYPDNDSGSGRMSSTFVVPKNITSIVYATGYIQFSGSGTGTLSHLKLEKGNLATDWCPNPADNATVTAFSKLSQTVDGMKLDIAKKIEQKDLNGYATQTWAQNQINTTANGINGTISSVKSTVDGHTTSINDLKADSSSFKSQFTTVNNTLGKQTTDISTLQTTSKELTTGFNTLTTDNITNKNDISQLKQTATELNSTIATVQTQVQDSSVGVNLLRNARTLDGWDVWAASGGGKGFLIEDISTDSGQYRMAHIYRNVDGQQSDAPFWPGEKLSLNAGQVYTISIWAHSLGIAEQPVSWTLWLNWDKDNSYQGVGITKTTAPDWTRYSATFTATVGGQVNNVRIVPYFNAGAAAGVGGSVYLLKPKLEKGSVATDFSVNPADNATVTALSSISQTIDSIQTTVRGKVDNDTYQADVKILKNQISSVVKKSDDNWSSIQQNSSDISLRVEKKGVINAVNVSTEGIQIYGDKLHITATTYIDDAIIKDAMIESIKADKIKVGTLDATKVNIIHLNANNITAGIINGSNLTINLDTGNVEFQKGRVHSADNAIDINIDNKYISVANSSNRVMLKDGEMQFVQPGVLDLQTSPYFRIHNRGGLAFGGAEMVGRDYVTVSNAANSDDFFMHTLGVEKFSGLFTGYNRASGEWRPTKVAGAERGVIISGGSVTSGQTLASSPSIIVGYSNSSSNLTGGNRILLDAAFVHSFSTYTKTSSQSPNVYVSTDGALLRSTSASKYKTNIVRGYSTDYGKKLIQLPTATWIDKASVKRYNDDPSQPVPILNYGMIAEDLADAGLEQLVVRNKEGELEGIQYDRIAVALLPLLSEWKQIIDNQEKEINELKKEQ